jgi:cytochrome d ubiquinol oxidase subunit I
MLLASYLTGAFCVAATGAWYLLRREFTAEAQIMLRMGLYLAAFLVPVQLFFGHLTGDYVHNDQPAKFAAIEGRWHDEQPAGEVLVALPDAKAETNLFEIKIPILGSLIGSLAVDLLCETSGVLVSRLPRRSLRVVARRRCRSQNL